MIVKTVKWTEAMSVGVAALDDDHKKIIALLNKTIAALYAGVADKAMIGILDELDAYTQGHFQREEAYLEERGYPGLGPHRDQHANLMAHLGRMRGADRGGELMEMLNIWLIDHILRHDMEYRRYLESGETAASTGTGGETCRPS
ncbi:MAG: hemerythrin family protein [Magnetospirillum sp.]|nr:hemerythrin family protein [Magnetospirillum sp.]